jgi:hypothetical protein
MNDPNLSFLIEEVINVQTETKGRKKKEKGASNNKSTPYHSNLVKKEKGKKVKAYEDVDDDENSMDLVEEDM